MGNEEDIKDGFPDVTKTIFKITEDYDCEDVNYNDAIQVFYANNSGNGYCCFFNKQGILIPNSTLPGHGKQPDGSLAGKLIVIDSDKQTKIRYEQLNNKLIKE